MKIISKFKDYYDFAAGHDTDPRKIYNRKAVMFSTFKDYLKVDLFWHLHHYCSNPNGIPVKDIFKGGVWFCDKYYPFILEAEAWNFYYEYSKIPQSLSVRYNYKQSKWVKKGKKKPLGYANHLEDYFDPAGSQTDRVFNGGWKYRKDIEAKKCNTLYGHPIVYTWYDVKYYKTVYVVDGPLDDIHFGAIKSPQEAHTELYNWIPYHEPSMPDDPTDMSRFENKGYDKKASFRGKQ